jgi:cytochrome P450
VVAAPSINDPAFLEDPFPFYEMGRAMSPLFVPNLGLWMAFNYDECLALLRDPATWSSGMASNAPQDGPQPSMLGSNPPRHTRLRALVSQAFTPRMIEQLEPRLRQIAAELLEPVLAKGECDLVETLSYPLPVIAIAEILGVEPGKRDKFKQWSDEVVATLGTGDGEQEEGATEGQIRQSTFDEISDYFNGLCEERRAHPRSDLISGLVQAEMEGEKLSFDELLQMLILLLVAGNETTTNLIGNAMQEFIRHPDQFARVEADPSLLPNALEEVLRFSSPVQATVRRATSDVEFKGQQIAMDQQVIVWLAAANRDPAQFPDPLAFDVTRNPNRHLAFGMGIHFCLGAPLARLEAKIAFEELMKRTTNFRRTDSNLLPRVPTFIMRGVRELPIAFDRR